MVIEGYVSVQPETFWWPVKHSNHWGNMDWDCEWRLQICTTCNFLMNNKIFWPLNVMDRDGNLRLHMCTICNLQITQWFTLSIELHGLRWWMKVTYVYKHVTFWWPVRHFNHWTTRTEMVDEGYICVQHVTFWWPVNTLTVNIIDWDGVRRLYMCTACNFWWPARHPNHQTTSTEMVSKDYIRLKLVTFS